MNKMEKRVLFLSNPALLFSSHSSKMRDRMSIIRRDMIFSALFVGDENLLRHLVWTSAQRLGAEWAWEGGVQVCWNSFRTFDFQSDKTPAVCLPRPPPCLVVPITRPRYCAQGQGSGRLARVVRAWRRAEEGWWFFSATQGASYRTMARG